MVWARRGGVSRGATLLFDDGHISLESRKSGEEELEIKSLRELSIE